MLTFHCRGNVILKTRFYSTLKFRGTMHFMPCATLVENWSNWSFEVQIPWDICTRFGCYLYSTEWVSIIKAHFFLTFPNGMTRTIWFSNRNFRFLHVNGKYQWTKFLSFRVTRLDHTPSLEEFGGVVRESQAFSLYLWYWTSMLW